MVKIFQFLGLSTKFLAVLRLSVNPIETLLKQREVVFYNNISAGHTSTYQPSSGLQMLLNLCSSHNII